MSTLVTKKDLKSISTSVPLDINGQSGANFTTAESSKTLSKITDLKCPRSDVLYLDGWYGPCRGRWCVGSWREWVGVVHLGSGLAFLLFELLFVAVAGPGLPCSCLVRFWGGLRLCRWVPALFGGGGGRKVVFRAGWCVSFAPLLFGLPPVDLSPPRKWPITLLNVDYKLLSMFCAIVWHSQ